MGGGHHERATLGEQHRAHDDVRLLDGQLRDQEIDLLLPQCRDGSIVVRHVQQLNRAAWVTGGEGVSRLHDELTGPGSGEADAQHTTDVHAGVLGVGDGSLNLLVRGQEVVAELSTNRSEDNLTAAAFEQGATDASFQRLDRLAHPAGRDVQPLGGPREMQFLGQRQKRLDLVPLHQAPPFATAMRHLIIDGPGRWLLGQ